MAMFFQWGTYVSALNEAGITIEREDITSQASGLLIGIKERWTINGFLQASNPQGLTALTTALELAFSVNFMYAQLVYNDGVHFPKTLRSLLGITPVGGTKVVSGPSYPFDGSSDAEYSTFRRYRVVIEGAYLLPAIAAGGGGGPGGAPLTLAWHQTLSQRGTGLSRFLYRQPLNGLPMAQQTAQYTTYQVVQRGNAVGVSAYPIPPDPLWPQYEHLDQREIEMGNPERVGTVYVNWPISWTYVFESTVAPPPFLNQFKG